MSIEESKPRKSRPASSKPRLKRADRERQVLDKAEEIFLSQGFDQTSMEDVARACGVTKPVIYQLFGSKQGLYEAVLTRAGTAVSEMMIDVLSVADQQDRLEQSLHAMMSYVYQHGPMMKDAPIRLMAVNAPLRHQLADAAIAILSEMRPATMTEEEARWRVAPYAHALLGAAEGGAHFWADEPRFTVADAQTASRKVLEAVLKIVKDVLS